MLLSATIALVTFLPQDLGVSRATDPVPARPSIVWGDADGDELADALVLSGAGTVRLLRNRGDGGFDDVSREAGLLGIRDARFATWSDYDADGDGDLLLGTSNGSRLFASQGGGTFAEATLDAGLFHVAGDLAADWTDYDRDGRPDLYLRGEAGDLLYHNAGAGRFELVDLGAIPTALPAESTPRTPERAPEGTGGTGESGDRPRGKIDAPPRESPRTPSSSERRPVAPPAGESASGGSADATAIPVCAKTIEDKGAPGNCLSASSVATLGRLYPLSSNLFVDSTTGFVGIGTTSPLVRFQVEGQVGVQNELFAHDVVLGTDDDSLRFPASAGTSSPMIEMFASGITNADRMVIAHSPGAPTYGLAYEDDDDKFVFQMMPTDPTLTIDLGQSVDSAVDVSFRDDDDSITFPAASGSTSPMIHLFASGTANANRQVLAHSPALPEWGLKVDDTADALVFQQTNALPVLTVGVQTKSVTVHDGTLAVARATTGNTLDVQTGVATQPRVANLQRTNDAGINEDVLQIVCGTNSNAGAQLIEAERGTDLEFRVDADGDVFADGVYGGPADFAEMMRVEGGASSVEPGDVLVLDPRGGVALAAYSHSTRVSGIYSTRPGFVGSEREWDLPAPAGAGAGERATLDLADMARLYDEVPVAVIGIVPAKVSAENGPIRPGDLLVTSNTPGHAMRADRPAPGTVVGKALGALDAGTGTIRVLVTLQ